MRSRVMFGVLLALAANSEIIDRIAVSIGNQVITASEVDRQLRLTAFFNGEQPKFTPEARRDAADRLVEQALIRKEMASAGAPPISTDTPAVDKNFELVLRSRYPDQAAYDTALRNLRLRREDVQKQLEWMTRLSRFVDVRFRPGVQVPEEESREYYESTWVPAWKRQHQGTPPPFDDALTDVQQDLISERANAAMDRWLGQVRTQTRIIYHQEAFR